MHNSTALPCFVLTQPSPQNISLPLLSPAVSVELMSSSCHCHTIDWFLRPFTPDRGSSSSMSAALHCSHRDRVMISDCSLRRSSRPSWSDKDKLISKLYPIDANVYGATHTPPLACSIASVERRSSPSSLVKGTQANCLAANASRGWYLLFSAISLVPVFQL